MEQWFGSARRKRLRIVDTHVLLWWLDDPKQLSKQALFDRMLVALALREGFRVVSRDVDTAKYPVPQILA